MLPMLNKTLPGFMDELFGRDYLPSFFESNQQYNIPSVNVIENDDEFVIDVAAPGLDKKDFNIEIDNGLLTISSEKKTDHEEKDGKILRREFNYASFKRTFSLPDSVNEDKIKANHKDGILHLSIPKKDEAKVKPAREIKIV